MSPAICLAGIRYSARQQPADRYRLETNSTLNSNRRCALAVGAVAEYAFAAVSAAPAPGGSVGCDGAAMRSADGHRPELYGRGNDFWNESADTGLVAWGAARGLARLQVLVVAPAPCVAGIVEGAVMEETAGDLSELLSQCSRDWRRDCSGYRVGLVRIDEAGAPGGQQAHYYSKERSAGISKKRSA